jgi:hypothetical protein
MIGSTTFLVMCVEPGTDECHRQRERQSTFLHEPQPAPPIADSELASADQILVEMAQQVQAALLRSARPNE